MFLNSSRGHMHLRNKGSRVLFFALLAAQMGDWRKTL
jgi:hypothetical protein